MTRLDLRAFEYLRRGRFWLNLWNDINEHNCWGLAAQLSYYFLLAFVPFLMFLMAVVGFMPVSPELQQRVLTGLDRILPDSAYALVRDIVMALVNSGSAGTLSVAIALTIWSASRAFNGMVAVLNGAYQVKETRSFFRLQALALGVTVLVCGFVVAAMILVFFGDWLVTLLLSRNAHGPYSRLQPYVRSFYWAARWMLVFAFLNMGIQIVYFTLPARRLPWRLFSPGSVVATSGWVLASKSFALYVKHVADYQKVYGSLGALIILMVWFYLSSLFLLVGGEVDSGIFRLRRR